MGPRFRRVLEAKVDVQPLTDGRLVMGGLGIGADTLAGVGRSCHRDRRGY